ncbi:MAG TPA: prolyl oligopeptidase family serine peptidase [Polyangiaceae bacterium]|nr:prolyl oligopeptidase family serine peptidase [Polyangiaceae bacterium]
MKQELLRTVTTVALAAALQACSAEDPPPSGASSAGASAGGTSALGGGSSTAGSPSAAGTSALPSGGTASSSGGTANAGGNAGGAAASSGAASSAGAGTTGGSTGTGATKSAGCGVTDPLASGTATIDVSGTLREYILKVPDGYDANTPYKLIFGWHWRGGKASDVSGGQIGGGPYYGLEKLAKGTAIFVSPNGIDNGWANTGGRDITFLKALLALINSKLCIDQSRIFSTGFSYGGMMSNTIGCEMADVFRAIAPMSGALYSGCTKSNTQPIAVWMSHGTGDDVVPLADGKAALDVFLKKNGCGTQTTAVTPTPCVAYQGCSAGHPVNYCEFDGKHSAPSFASSAVWQFFSQF